MYQLRITPAALKEAKKLPNKIREIAQTRAEQLRFNPNLGQRLSGSLHQLYSYHFRVSGQDYRIAYTIDHNQKLIVVHLIKSRENFYQHLKRLIS